MTIKKARGRWGWLGRALQAFQGRTTAPPRGHLCLESLEDRQCPSTLTAFLDQYTPAHIRLGGVTAGTLVRVSAEVHAGEPIEEDFNAADPVILTDPAGHQVFATALWGATQGSFPAGVNDEVLTAFIRKNYDS